MRNHIVNFRKYLHSRTGGFWLKAIFSVIGILLVGAAVFAQFITLAVTDEYARDHFGSKRYPVKVFYDHTTFHTVRSIQVGDTSKPITVLIHGAPSSSVGWQSYLKDSNLLATQCLVAVDRPGYGYSDFGYAELSILRQAQAIAPVLARYAHLGKKVQVMGSSYGGPVIGMLAALYPAYVAKATFISSSVQPDAEKIYPISYPFSHWSLRWIVPRVLQVANKEKLNHSASLKALLPYWSKITCPIHIIHGRADSLIYFSNAQFLRGMAINAARIDTTFIEKQGHYIPWQRRGVVLKAIVEEW